jgi:hypothetical protein
MLLMKMPKNLYLLFVWSYAVSAIIALAGCSEPGGKPTLARTVPSMVASGPIPSTLGINVKWDWYPVDRLRSQLPDHITLLRDLGIGWVRMVMTWEFIETTRGSYDFSRQDAAAKALNDAGISVLFTLTCKNPLYDGGQAVFSPHGRESFLRFTRAAAQRYVVKQVAWEICNEPNKGPAGWAVDDNLLNNYLALADAATNELRMIVPDQAVFGPAISGPNDHGNCTVKQYFIDGVLDHPVSGRWSGLSVHPYRKTTAPEEMLPEVDALRCEIDAAREGQPPLPVVISEFGYSTYHGRQGVSEDEQASYALRFFFSALSRQLPMAIWYTWQDPGTDLSDEESLYGILRYGDSQTRAPQLGNPNFYKAAYHAFKRMNQLLQGYKLEKNLTLTPPASGLQLHNPSAGSSFRAYVAWNSEDDDISVNLPFWPGTWQATDLVNGNQWTVSVLQRIGGTTVTLGAHPVFFLRMDPSS